MISSTALQRDLERLQQREGVGRCHLSPTNAASAKLSEWLKDKSCWSHLSDSWPWPINYKTGENMHDGTWKSSYQRTSSKSHMVATKKKANNSLAFLYRNLALRMFKPSATQHWSDPSWSMPHQQWIHSLQHVSTIQQLEAVQHIAVRFIKGD